MTIAFRDDELTEDALIAGKVRLLQPRSGYRAATDPVFLAAAAMAQPGAQILDVGCGAGAAMYSLAARIKGLDLHGLEIQSGYAALARRNAALNGAEAQIWEGDLFAPPQDLRQISFDLVITNPPYFDPRAPGASDPGRDLARRGAAGRGATEWAAASLARVRSGGRLAVIYLTESLPALLAGLSGAGDITVIPLQARVGRPARRVILTARKGARGPFRLTAPFIIHEGPEHVSDADDFTKAAAAVLREGAALTA